jgi:hypothetical protein
VGVSQPQVGAREQPGHEAAAGGGGVALALGAGRPRTLRTAHHLQQYIFNSVSFLTTCKSTFLTVFLFSPPATIHF